MTSIAFWTPALRRVAIEVLLFALACPMGFLAAQDQPFQASSAKSSGDDIPPVVQLPPIDMSQQVARAESETDPIPLGVKLQQQKFILKFDVHQPPGAPQPRIVAIVNIGKISKRHGFVSIAGCQARPTNGRDEPVLHYEVECPAPRRMGEALIEVRFGNDAYLVRSVTIE